MAMTAVGIKEKSSLAKSAIEQKTPRIAELLCQCWKQPDCKQNLGKLLGEDRNEQFGLPPDVSDELRMLYQLCDLREQGQPATEEEVLSDLESRFPRLAEKLCLVWGSRQECGEFLNSLVFDERGNRQGFPPEVTSELFMLCQLLDSPGGLDMYAKQDFVNSAKSASSTSSTNSAKSATEERFPRIAEMLCQHWRGQGCKEYLRGLIIDDRGDRQGFPADVSTELFMLYRILEIPEEDDVWARLTLLD